MDKEAQKFVTTLTQYEEAYADSINLSKPSSFQKNSVPFLSALLSKNKAHITHIDDDQMIKNMMDMSGHVVLPTDNSTKMQELKTENGRKTNDPHLFV